MSREMKKTAKGLNRSIVECKDVRDQLFLLLLAGLSRSIVECKVGFIDRPFLINRIK
jgi:hypothetical protein